jgi:hypothetical protein
MDEPTGKLRAQTRDYRKEDDKVQETPEHFASKAGSLYAKEIAEPNAFPTRLSPKQQKTPNIDKCGVDSPPRRLSAPRRRMAMHEESRRHHHLCQKY